MGTRQATSGSNPLQALMGNLGGLQQSIQTEWNNQERDLRRDLPWVSNGAKTRLERGRAALDKVIVEKLGSDSNVRNRLTTLDGQLKQQMNRIIEQRQDGLTFHHAAQAHADYQCSVNPQDDVVITPQSVQVVGSNGNLTMTPQGDVTFNGKTVTVDNAARQQAIDYQSALVGLSCSATCGCAFLRALYCTAPPTM
ncbi:hypothetical protein CRX72_03760 [Pantoea sp. BRM17]|nr:hypothetical protein CRX72_03760 [Pantoea sp. BRM17]